MKNIPVYNPAQIEGKWQLHWENNHSFAAEKSHEKPKLPLRKWTKWRLPLKTPAQRLTKLPPLNNRIDLSNERMKSSVRFVCRKMLLT